MVIRICVGLNFQLPVSQCLQKKTGLKSLKNHDRLHTFNTSLHLENTNIKNFFWQMMFTVGNDLKDSTRQGWKKMNFS